jgi:hypothetical protein
LQAQLLAAYATQPDAQRMLLDCFHQIAKGVSKRT